MLADVALDEPAGETVIALAGGGIEHHSASAVRRPGPQTLLRRDRQLVPCAPVSQPPCAIARGQLGQGKDPDLGEKIGIFPLAEIPIWGRKSVSSRNRYLTPSSVSPKPEAHPSPGDEALATGDRKSTRLNSSHLGIS